MQSIVSIAEPGRIEVVDQEDLPLGAHDVRIRTLYSGISAGTELSTYRGTNPHQNKRWDASTRLFVDGPADTPYPVLNAGYEEVGEVIELGSAATGLQLGDRVWGTWGHRTGTVQDAAQAAERTVPRTADARIGLFSHIGAVALNAVLDADIHIGETVAVFGLGVPGQLVAQLARLNGGRVIAVDGIAARRELALRLGAVAVFDPADGGVAERIRDLTGSRGADVAIEISGSYLGLHEAIRSVAYNARVCAAGFYQGDGIGLRLGEEFHHNRVSVISSQISGQAPAIASRWDRSRLNRTIIDLAVDERLAVLPLISRMMPFREAAQAFRLLDQQPRDELQVVLDFTDLS